MEKNKNSPLVKQWLRFPLKSALDNTLQRAFLCVYCWLSTRGLLMSKYLQSTVRLPFRRKPGHPDSSRPAWLQVHRVAEGLKFVFYWPHSRIWILCVGDFSWDVKMSVWNSSALTAMHRWGVRRHPPTGWFCTAKQTGEALFSSLWAAHRHTHTPQKWGITAVRVGLEQKEIETKEPCKK